MSSQSPEPQDVMEDWSEDVGVERFAAMLSKLRLGTPADKTRTNKTQDFDQVDMAASRPHFHEIAKLSIEDFKISDDHTLDWATRLLRQYGPVQDTSNIIIWDRQSLGPLNPSTILSENDTMIYIRISILQPALATAKFLRSQHLGLSAPDPCKFEIFNCSSSGISGRADFGIVDKKKWFCTAIETKTYRVCRSKGLDTDERYHGSLPLLPYLQWWLESEGGSIAMTYDASQKNFTKYNHLGKNKIQKILFQVRSDPIETDVATKPPATSAGMECLCARPSTASSRTSENSFCYTALAIRC